MDEINILRPEMESQQILTKFETVTITLASLIYMLYKQNYMITKNFVHNKCVINNVIMKSFALNQNISIFHIKIYSPS